MPSGDLPACRGRCRPGRRRWPDQELDRQWLLACPVTVLPSPHRTGTIRVRSLAGERMSMLADIVEVVIGVDTHKDNHTAAVVDARTRAVLDRLTVSADPDG